ncbi:MAG: hypothetical protein AVDCRST_MAG79-891, partial [uncultured Thermoleophilia bacterium]
CGRWSGYGTSWSRRGRRCSRPGPTGRIAPSSSSRRERRSVAATTSSAATSRRRCASTSPSRRARRPTRSVWRCSTRCDVAPTRAR